MFYVNENELKHYGVLGMRWGVRRSPEQLRRAAGKLEAKNEKLQSKADKANLKAAKLRAKSHGLFRDSPIHEGRRRKAATLEYKGKKYVSQMLKNETTMSVFNNTADALDQGKVLKGNKYFMKYEQATIKKRFTD